MQTLVSTKDQIVIPKEAGQKREIKPGQKMDVEINGEKVTLKKAKKSWKWPEDYIKNLKDPWEGEDREKYLEKERNSWE